MLYLLFQNTRYEIHRSTWIPKFYPKTIRHLCLKPSSSKPISQLSPKPKDGNICAHWNSFPRVSLAVLSGCVRLVWPKEGMCSLKPFSQEVEGLIPATPIHPCRAHPACPASGYMTWSLDHLGNTGAMQMTLWFLGNITAQIKRRHLWDRNQSMTFQRHHICTPRFLMSV